MSTRRVIVVPYDAAWPTMFDAESSAVAAAMGDNFVAIHHIGSTSVPGLCAKPIIDMLAIVRDLGVLDLQSAQLQRLGYEALGEFGIPGRRYFRRDDGAGVRTHQVHAFAEGSPHVERHLAFRDFLRAHAEHAAEYGELKRRLADLHPTNIDAYTDGKDGFIKSTERMALERRRSPAATSRSAE